MILNGGFDLLYDGAMSTCMVNTPTPKSFKDSRWVLWKSRLEIVPRSSVWTDFMLWLKWSGFEMEWTVVIWAFVRSRTFPLINCGISRDIPSIKPFTRWSASYKMLHVGDQIYFEATIRSLWMDRWCILWTVGWHHPSFICLWGRCLSWSFLTWTVEFLREMWESAPRNSIGSCLCRGFCWREVKFLSFFQCPLVGR